MTSKTSCRDMDVIAFSGFEYDVIYVTDAQNSRIEDTRDRRWTTPCSNTDLGVTQDSVGTLPSAGYPFASTFGHVEG